MSDPFSAPVATRPYASPTSLPSASDGGRPIGVTVFAILGFLFFGLGLLGILGSTVLLFAGRDAMATNPVVQLCQTSPFYFIFTVITTLLGVVFLFVLAAASIGLLKMAPWGRKLILIYAVYAIVSTILSNAINYVYLLPLMQAEADRQAAAAPAAMREVIRASTSIGMVFGIGAALLFPLAIVWYFNRSAIKARFQPPAGIGY